MQKVLILRDDGIFFRCPKCQNVHNFDTPNTMKQWTCMECNTTYVYPNCTFLEALVS